MYRPIISGGYDAVMLMPRLYVATINSLCCRRFIDPGCIRIVLKEVSAGFFFHPETNLQSASRKHLFY